MQSGRVVGGHVAVALLILMSTALASTALAAFAQSSPSPTPPGPRQAPPVPSVSEPSFLRITITASRSPIGMDTAAGVSAEIKNVSAVPVRLWENETVFSTVPEIRIYGESRQSIVGCATFPTQGNVRPLNRPARGYDLLIQPGDSYRVTWDLATNGCTGEVQNKLRIWQHPLMWIDEQWQRIAFTAGTYKVYLNAVFYPEDKSPYHVTTEGQEVQISASEQMVLLGAFLGGLVAYLIKLYYGVQTPLRVTMTNATLRTIIGGTEWFVAGVFAAAMVVLASRLSDTFPVKVSANDFWGAMTLGFVFQWIGVKLLEKLPGIATADNVPR